MGFVPMTLFVCSITSVSDDRSILRTPYLSTRLEGGQTAAPTSVGASR
jgi:hypothetical protein